jgi:carbamoyltransferase
MSAYATSGFTDSAILVVDGMGSPWEDLSSSEQSAAKVEERGGWESISLYSAVGCTLTPLAKHLVRDGKWLVTDDPGMPRFGSLGGMFSAAAKQIFDNHMEAGKVMGLAAYGRPEIRSAEFYLIKDDRFKFSDTVCGRYKEPVRWPEMEAEYKVLAASVQAALEEALSYLVCKLRLLCSSKNLCFTGGVALNSLANERLVRESGYDNIHFFPAAEDSGIAVGAAFYGLFHLHGAFPRRRIAKDTYGKRYNQAEVLRAVGEIPGLEVRSVADPIEHAAEMLTNGKAIGWFQGGSELGPRALGQRSILFDPRRPDGKDHLNTHIKHRETFRPFAPACLLEESPRWFELSDRVCGSPFMMRACRVRPEVMDLIPAVVHVDGSARIQTLTKQNNGDFYDLVRRFYEKTGIPMVLNTSFNIAGEPLVETPADALWCLLATGLDECVIEGRIVVKKNSFHSLLDLYPQLASGQLKVVTTLEDVTNGRPSAQHSYLTTTCRTPWGDFEQFFPWSVVRILERIDGSTNGRRIFADVSVDGNVFTEVDLTRVLLELAYAGLISFAETPFQESTNFADD